MKERILSGWHPYVILILIGCLFYLPGITRLPPTDRDEARFAQASRQMLETGNFVDIRFQDKPRYKKPIGIYWLQAASVRIFSDPESPRIWPYRLPSLLGALISVLLTFYLGKRLFDSETGFLAALLLESSVLLFVEATLATTDAALLASITAMMTMLGIIYTTESGSKNKAAWGFWVFCGVGILLKGPVPLLIAILSVAVLSFSDRSPHLLRNLKPLWGGLLLLLIVAPWFWAIHRASGGQFVRKAFTEDLLPKLLGGHESHGAPPGLYFGLIVILFWPGILALLPATRQGWRSRAHRAQRFLLAWSIPTWIAFELIPTKLPHYILPVFPAVALLTGRYLVKISREPSEERRGLILISKGAFMAVASGICLGGLALGLYFNHRIPLAMLVTIAAGTWLVKWAASFPRRAGLRTIVGGCLLSGALVIMPVFAFVLPTADPIWLSLQVKRALSGASLPRTSVVASVGYHEPSLVFLLGTRTRIDSVEEAVRDLKRGRVTYLLVSEKYRPILLEKAGNLGRRLTLVKRIRGFNYSKGKWLTLSLFEVGQRF